jgi:hypothetical protein
MSWHSDVHLWKLPHSGSASHASLGALQRPRLAHSMQAAQSPLSLHEPEPVDDDDALE